MHSLIELLSLSNFLTRKSQDPLTLSFANVNSLTEINFEEALAEAARLDKHMKETGKVVGPLHGIPFSVKV